MGTASLLQLLSATGAMLFFTAGVLVQRLRSERRAVDAHGSQPGPAPLHNDPPQDDQVAELHHAVGALQQELAEKQGQLREAKEQVRAVSELLKQQLDGAAGDAAANQPPAARTERRMREEASQMAQMHAALQQLEDELSTARTRATDAEDKLRGMAELWSKQQAHAPDTAGQSAKSARSEEKDRRDAERERVVLQQGVSSLEEALRASRSREADAQEKLRALEELLRQRENATGSPSAALERTLSAEQRARRAAEAQVSQMHAAVTELEALLSRRQHELQDAREKVAALEDLIGRRSA